MEDNPRQRQVSALGRYILEEWTEDYQHGRLDRREFLRRIVVFAGGSVAAVPLLSSLGLSASANELSHLSSDLRAQAQASGVTVAPDDPDITVEMVSFDLGGVPVFAYLARPSGSETAPGVIVVHENRGLVEHTKDIARRLAKEGYVALAVDLASPAGGTEQFSDPAEVTALLGQTPPEELVVMLNAGVRYLQAQPFVQADRLGAIGFCFGGGMVWRLVSQNPDLVAAAPFYGPNPPLEDVPSINAAVLAIYGELDQRINAGIPELEAALQSANVVHEMVIYPDANHAFFNDTGERYQAEAAEDAWQRVLAWFAQYLEG